jgi:hypothetical protein
MKNIKGIIILLISTRLWGDSGTYLWGGKILDKLDSGISVLENPICLTDLVNLNKADLRVLRNAVYAKHGYIFRSNDLYDYFIKFSWYRAEYSNVDDRLNEIDINNIFLIQRVENNYPNNSNELIGLWWDPPIDRGFAVDAAGPDQLRIYSNGIYVIVYTHRGDNYIFLSGLWHYENNIFQLNNEIIRVERRDSFRDGIRDTLNFERILWWKWDNDANYVM